MTFAVTEACVDVKDRSCTEVCPVDCIYEGDRKMYINPSECIDCGACMTECPMGAIVRVEDATGDALRMAEDNACFFADVLDGRDEPIGSPGAAEELGRIGVDTAAIAALPEASR